MQMMEERWTDEFLDKKRTECDPEADDAVRDLSEKQVDLVNELMKQLILNEQPVPEDLPPSLRRFFDDTDALPDWADHSRLLEGQAFFNRCGPQMLLALFCAALPCCYAASKGVKVLHRTGKMGDGRRTSGVPTSLPRRLMRHFQKAVDLITGRPRRASFHEGLPTNLYRRILETAQMVIDVMAPRMDDKPAGLEPGGRGIRSAQKVRLMHAAVRRLVAQKGTWNPEWGQPINQEDLAGTLLAFSVVTLRALPKLGYTPERWEIESYYHSWRVAGHVMGIDDGLLPAAYEDGERLFDAIARRHFSWSQEGAEMTQALLKLLDHVTPGNLFDDLGEVLIHHLLGSTTAEAAGVPRKDDWKSRLLLSPLKGLGWVADHMDEQSLFTEELCTLLGRKVLEGVVWVGRGRDRLPLRIPRSLRETWDVAGWERAPEPSGP